MEKKRIAVLVSYDKDGMIDDYIPYMMRDLQECVERIVVVFNGSLQPEFPKKASFADAGRDRTRKPRL